MTRRDCTDCAHRLVQGSSSEVRCRPEAANAHRRAQGCRQGGHCQRAGHPRLVASPGAKDWRRHARSFRGKGSTVGRSGSAVAGYLEPLLRMHRCLRENLADLHRLVLRAVRVDPICRRLMTMPGIGPLTALTYRATIDDPKRFRRSRSVGAYLGLTPRRYQSGEVDRVGRITKVGDSETRTALFEAANVILRPTTRWSSMKAWAMKIANRQGARRAKVALARRMAVTLHRMWVDEQDFRWSAA